MKEPQDAGKYQVDNDGPVLGQVIGDNATVHQHFYATDKAAPPTKPQRVWNIPYLRNDYFTGREEILASLHACFKANNATALSQRHAMSGLGGIGKTQIAVEYAYRYHEEYQAVLWAHAESHEALTSSFVEIAKLLDLPQKDEKDQTIIVQAVKRWLQDNHGWLLILDNADEPVIIREFLPTKCDGHILLTTRAQALGGLAQRIEVDTFTPELGALFLLRRATLIAADDVLGQASPQDRELALQISQKLGGLPLALDQAGAYIEQTQCSLSDYLSLYRTRRAEMLKQYGPLEDNDPHKPVVATTWSLSFQRAKEKCAAAADLLRLCAFLAPDAIPEEIVIKGAEHLGPVLQAAANDPIALNKAIATLGAYSLIGRDPAEKTLSVHRLVQVVLCDNMDIEVERQWMRRAVLAINVSCPNVGDVAQWGACDRWLPHAQVCAVWIEQEQMKLPEAACVLNEAGYYLKQRARYGEAELLLKHGLSISEHQLGSQQHRYTVALLGNLAILYKSQGRYSEAEPLFKRALAISKQQLGPRHLSTAISLNNLAGLCVSQGKYSEAEPLYQRALSIYEQKLGPQHPDTARSLNGLAELYRKQGKYSEAEPLLQRALHISERQLGFEHLQVAYPLNNLANLYRDQSRYEQAEPLYQRALHIRRQRLGVQHPETAETIHDLALHREAQGNSEEAKNWYTRALTLREQALGVHHPKTMETRRHFIALLHAMGRDEEAKQLEEKQ